jgi:hypothetical protein
MKNVAIDLTVKVLNLALYSMMGMMVYAFIYVIFAACTGGIHSTAHMEP